MKRFFGWMGGLVIMALVVGGTGAALFLYTPSDYERRLSAVAALAQRGVDHGHWPGVMWAIVKPGEILQTGAAGFSDLSSETLMTPDTVMPIGSITKVFVGLSAAIAASEGNFDLDAPVSDYLTIPFDPPDGKPRTFGALATHTSGIVDTADGYEAVGYHYGSVRHPIELADFLARYLGEAGDLYAPDNFADWGPGERYAYSNIGAGLAAKVIADAVGQPFERYSTDKIVRPLGLSGFWGPFGPPEDSELVRATLYDRDANGAFEPIEAYGLATWPDGQFNASAADLAKLMAALLNEGEWEGTELVPSDAVALQQSPRVRDIPGKQASDDYIGLFWERETLEFGPLALTLVGHSGGDPGVVTFMYQVPDNPTAFVLMFNGEPNGIIGLLSVVRLIRLMAGMPLPHSP
ncbi:MAG: serine hydrolase domain-containing protein [Pseudomonadota bacterium]